MTPLILTEPASGRLWCSPASAGSRDLNDPEATSAHARTRQIQDLKLQVLNLTSIVGDAKEASARILGNQFNRCPFDRLDAEGFELSNQVLKHSHQILN